GMPPSDRPERLAPLWIGARSSRWPCTIKLNSIPQHPPVARPTMLHRFKRRPNVLPIQSSLRSSVLLPLFLLFGRPTSSVHSSGSSQSGALEGSDFALSKN